LGVTRSLIDIVAEQLSDRDVNMFESSCEARRARTGAV